MTWHDDRPPTCDEVPNYGLAFVIRQSGAREILCGQVIRKFWKHPGWHNLVIAWHHLPEDYQPPERPQPNQWWETQGGRKVFVGAKCERARHDDKLIGWMEIGENCYTESWCSDGRYLDKEESVNDLVRRLPDDTTWDTP